MRFRIPIAVPSEVGLPLAMVGIAALLLLAWFVNWGSWRVRGLVAVLALWLTDVLLLSARGGSGGLNLWLVKELLGLLFTSLIFVWSAILFWKRPGGLSVGGAVGAAFVYGLFGSAAYLVPHGFLEYYSWRAAGGALLFGILTLVPFALAMRQTRSERKALTAAASGGAVAQVTRVAVSGAPVDTMSVIWSTLWGPVFFGLAIVGLRWLQNFENRSSPAPAPDA